MVGLAIISLVVGAVGAGMQYRASRQAANQQNAMATLNFQMQSDQIRQQREAAGMQSAINQQMASQEKSALERNAAVLEQQAIVNTSAGRENVKRTREDYARMMAAQRAQIGKGGIVDTTGSPLSMLADTAMEEQRAVDEVAFQTEGQRRGLFREADNQRTEGLRAEMDIYGAQATAGAAKLQASNALTQANFDLMGAQASSRGMRRSATGQLIGAVGGLAQQAYSMNWRTPRSS